MKNQEPTGKKCPHEFVDFYNRLCYNCGEKVPKSYYMNHSDSPSPKTGSLESKTSDEVEEAVQFLREQYLTESPDAKGFNTRSITHDFGTLTLDDKAYKKSAFYLLPQESMERWLRSTLTALVARVRDEALQEAKEARQFVEVTGVYAKGYNAGKKEGALAVLADLEKRVTERTYSDMSGNSDEILYVVASLRASIEGK